MKKLLCLISVLLAVSCAKGPQEARETQEARKEGEYLARINKATISAEDVNKEFSLLPPEIRQMYMTADGMGSLLDELIKKEVLYQEALKRGYDKKPDFAEQVREFNKRLMIEHLLSDEIEDKAVVSDAEVKEFYDTNRESFVREVPGEDKTETIEFERVEDLIRDRLVAEQQRAVFETYIETLKEKADIDIDREALKTAFGNTATP
jgi:peptidyl-prolyl cis-trans isomerase C